MKKPLRATLLEALGVRLFYRFMHGVTGDRMLSWTGPPTHSKVELSELLRDTRYYKWANGIRGALYVPPLFFLTPGKTPVAFWLLLFLVVFHTYCFLLEFYRESLVNAHREAGHMTPKIAVPEKALASSAVDHWYFSSKPWESPKLYVTLGLERLRRFVVFYTEWTKQTWEERKTAEKPQYDKKPLDLNEFERDTRTGEILHTAAGLLNLPALIAFYELRWALWFLYILFILVLDARLALLQRYHRVRVYQLWIRTGKVQPAAQAAGTENT